MNNLKSLEAIMDNMNRGVVYIDKNARIQLCNQRAKEITGIVFSAQIAHDRGKICDGDIVIIADNKLGDDDGELRNEDLEAINIRNKAIKPDDMLVAVGVYGNQKIRAEYKYIREHQIGKIFKLETNYLGFSITAAIDTSLNETSIKVNEKTFIMKYGISVGNLVVIDGKTGDIKFFQAKGYSIRNEDLGVLIRGGDYEGKTVEPQDVEVEGKKFLELFHKSKLSDRLMLMLNGKKEPIIDEIYEINKRMFICTVVPDIGEEGGIFLIIQDVEDLEKLLYDRNEIIKQIEEKQSRIRQSDTEFPEGVFDNIIGRSRKINEVKYMAYKASQNRYNVILTGESGTGKSRVARCIHEAGRALTPFVEVNCNAIAPSLFESELFGYVGGAFTGAKNEGKIGFFEAASGGSIFLDEIGELPSDIQVKLLHVLQSKEIYRVGSSKPVKIDVRVIAATNKNLKEEVMNGNFRQDLYYRINVFPIEIPPLRDRKSDIYLLINSIMEDICANYGLKTKQFSGEALEKLLEYNWPGNVRELENVIERAVAICETDIIYVEHLNIEKGVADHTMKDLIALEEKRIIENSLMAHNGNKQAAMEELKLSKTVFYEKIKKYEIG